MKYKTFFFFLSLTKILNKNNNVIMVERHLYCPLQLNVAVCYLFLSTSVMCSTSLS